VKHFEPKLITDCPKYKSVITVPEVVPDHWKQDAPIVVNLLVLRPKVLRQIFGAEAKQYSGNSTTLLGISVKSAAPLYWKAFLPMVCKSEGNAIGAIIDCFTNPPQKA